MRPFVAAQAQSMNERCQLPSHWQRPHVAIRISALISAAHTRHCGATNKNNETFHDDAHCYIQIERKKSNNHCALQLAAQQ